MAEQKSLRALNEEKKMLRPKIAAQLKKARTKSVTSKQRKASNEDEHAIDLASLSQEQDLASLSQEQIDMILEDEREALDGIVSSDDDNKDGLSDSGKVSSDDDSRIKGSRK